MKTWNDLETQLRSWTPRRPSARLKERLFTTPGAVPRARRLTLAWLAPATVCLLLLFVTFNQHSGELARLTVSSNEAPIIAVTMSNFSFAAYLPARAAGEQNSVPAGTFEWTNQGHSSSSIPSFRQSRTNDLKR